ncbi:MAG: hypothetical protein LBT53_10285, partial [Puniceicoccales bacterium]|nr:hypothetical protein [Puniceicoccales bacterium]
SLYLHLPPPTRPAHPPPPPPAPRFRVLRDHAPLLPYRTPPHIRRVHPSLPSQPLSPTPQPSTPKHSI